MHTPRQKDLRPLFRGGFTLIELLVVIGLMLVLAALAVLIIPSISTDQQATTAASQLQAWLNIAKERAARDRAPRGVRLLPGTANPVFVTDLVFLVQADDYYLGTAQLAYPNPASGTKRTIYSRATLTNNAAANTGTVTFNMYDPATLQSNQVAMPRTLTGGQNNVNLYPVQPGDHIIFDGGSTVYQILTVTGPTGPARGGTLTTTPAFPATLVGAGGYNTENYRIIRQPRPDGDEPMQLPVNIIIDVSAKNLGYDLPAIANTTGIDIMFAPDGRVIGPLAGYDKIILWVRDSTVDLDQNDPTLVVIYPRTGLIAAQPVDLSNYNSVTKLNPTPYTFTKTGVRSSE
jgi:prepilin-type N-terminal cleavage/methylation domain-containing protein